MSSIAFKIITVSGLHWIFLKYIYVFQMSLRDRGGRYSEWLPISGGCSRRWPWRFSSQDSNSAVAVRDAVLLRLLFLFLSNKTK